ncbi:MAG: hypothetical protein ACJ77Z_18105 [Thermoleophilaceae bacterium]
MARVTERETRQVEQANASGAEARANAEVFARKTLGQVADHNAELIGGLEKKPAVMGHSTGGLLAQIIADRGRAIALTLDHAAQKESVPRIEMTSTSRRNSACCKQVPSGLRGLTPQP